jgi:hypothetical protein
VGNVLVRLARHPFPDHTGLKWPPGDAVAVACRTVSFRRPAGPRGCLPESMAPGAWP